MRPALLAYQFVFLSTSQCLCAVWCTIVFFLPPLICLQPIDSWSSGAWIKHTGKSCSLAANVEDKTVLTKAVSRSASSSGNNFIWLLNVYRQTAIVFVCPSLFALVYHLLLWSSSIPVFVCFLDILYCWFCLFANLPSSSLLFSAAHNFANRHQHSHFDHFDYDSDWFFFWCFSLFSFVVCWHCLLLFWADPLCPSEVEISEEKKKRDSICQLAFALLPTDSRFSVVHQHHY